ncbi:ANTAR domain-containing protein [Mycobacterium sp. PS03-16]|uniref:GAF and ANTAR domain-containing protein n=1 Tax=Mycobacterium sp. PS03-16 TaxID=2559611 RepID=UPI0010748888|nr:GAF and ANTAR domain-containing protein [Mycobacterium sp. PS03-16]TFV58677.1 ANTAR domain-containing protein [Mycobacterium sp. PS03-16]
MGVHIGDEQTLDQTAGLVAPINLISHATLRTAVGRLQEQRGIADADIAFRALLRVAMRYGVKLRHLSAAVIATDTRPRDAVRAPAPALSFSLRGRGEAPKRADVLADLLTTAVDLFAAPAGAVQLRDAMHGGLCIESHTGVTEQFRQHFSYLEDGGSAAAHATAQCEVTRVDDVSISPLYRLADMEVLAGSGVHAEIAVPMCDEDGRNWGAVTVMFGTPHPRLDPFAIEMLHGHADSCAQWLRWYDSAVMPMLVDAVHDVAAALAAEKGGTAVSA